MQQQSELPEGWAETYLLTVVGGNKNQIVGGPFGSNLKVSDYQNDGVPIIRLQNIGYGEFIEKDIKYISLEKAEELNYHSFVKGDLVLAKLGTPIGKTCKIPEKYNWGIVVSDVVRIRIQDRIIDKNYLLHFLNSGKSLSQLNKQVFGTTRPRVNLKEIREMQILLPPLPEQHRIVSAIEALFARLDAANERLDRLPKILKRFRQSVLAAACDGKLTEDWREKNRIKKDSWFDLEFFDFILLKRGFDLPLSKRREGPYPIMTSSGIAAYHDECKMSGPGVVVGRSGSTGRVHYIDKDYWPHNTTLFVKDFKSNFTRFVYFFLINFDLKKYGASTAVPTLNRNNLRGIVVSIPPLPEQHEIVRRIDALFALADSIEAKVEAARERTEKLWQSVLAKAFSGELVETEAQLAKREGRDYEPADVLLERIKVEQGKSGKKGKAAKVKSTHGRE